MTNVQVRGVPDDVLARLRTRAGERGESLQQYLQALLAAEAGVHANNDLLEDAAADADLLVAAPGQAAEEIRRQRQQRDVQIDPTA